jgi:Uma2 family endonuclease
MGEAGLFTDQKVQLIDGEIVVLSPQSPQHYLALERIAGVLEGVFAGHWIRTQGPLALGLAAEPEPDVSVVTGAPEDYGDDHPHEAVLVVEVSKTTLAFDRREKASLYASAGIPEYWIVNLVDSQVEVYRDPVRDPNQRSGARYAAVSIFKLGESIVPIAAPEAVVAVTVLLA